MDYHIRSWGGEGVAHGEGGGEVKGFQEKIVRNIEKETSYHENHIKFAQLFGEQINLPFFNLP